MLLLVSEVRLQLGRYEIDSCRKTLKIWPMTCWLSVGWQPRRDYQVIARLSHIVVHILLQDRWAQSRTYALAWSHLFLDIAHEIPRESGRGHTSYATDCDEADGKLMCGRTYPKFNIDQHIVEGTITSAYSYLYTIPRTGTVSIHTSHHNTARQANKWSTSYWS